MSETEHEHRGDSVEDKVRLLDAAHRAGDYDVAMSLAESIKDTLGFLRQVHGDPGVPAIDRDTFGKTDDLPDAWRRWAQGWSFVKVMTLSETVGLPRDREPVDVALAFRAD